MTLPVLTAVTGASWEASLVGGLERDVSAVRIVRRCVDLADLLAAASAGTARAVLLSPDLRRLDREALGRLASAGVAVVGLFTPGDEDGERHLRRLGLQTVLAADSPIDAITAAVADAVHPRSPESSLPEQTDHDVPGRQAGSAPTPAPAEVEHLAYADPALAFHAVGEDDPFPPTESGIEPGTGTLIAVWGPTGAPGRSTIAMNLAAESAATGEPTLLADADGYGAVQAQLLGLLDESPGLAAAARLAANGSLDLPGLARVAPFADRDLRVLTGINRADRWPELRPIALDVVWSMVRSLASVTYVDCGFCTEQDEELSYDTTAPRRNGATLVTLQQADIVVAVGAADPVGVQRLIRGLQELRELMSVARLVVVLNKVRKGPVGSDPGAQLREALQRYAGIEDAVLVPYDRAAFDAALLQAAPLRTAAPGSAARTAIADLAHLLRGRPAPPRRRAMLRAR